MICRNRHEFRRNAAVSVMINFRIILVAVTFFTPVFSIGGFLQNENENPVVSVGFEGNSSVYRWANGYREMMLPTFNTTRGARRSVVSGGLFSIVSFDNVPCNSDSMEVGTCYSPRECTNLGGDNQGICAGNYGTCCVLRQTCGATITTNNTYFVNPDYPSPTIGPLTCSVKVQILDGVSQVYLEFLDFNIRGPSSGNCLNDTFTVTTSDGTATMLPILCGVNTGQSVYIPIGVGTGRASTGTARLAFDKLGFGKDTTPPKSNSGKFITLQFTLAPGDDPRTWKIRIVQFKPGDACIAPAGCTQYYRESTGVFQSFNYNGGMGELINRYCMNVCFAVNNPPNCGVVLTEGMFMLPDALYKFEGTPPDCAEGDYLLIEMQKYCGDTLNNGMLLLNVTAGTHFAKVQVCSGTNNPDMDVGFMLNYTPFPCTMIG